MRCSQSTYYLDPEKSNVLTSAVIISRFFNPRFFADASIWAFWDEELERPVIQELGYF